MSLRRHVEKAATEVASWPFAAPPYSTPTDLARDAYAVHRAELKGLEYDPGPWDELPPVIQDVWVTYVAKDSA